MEYKQLVRVVEENHGTIAVASSYEKGLQYLINTGWLTEMEEVYVEEKGWVRIKDHFGENWQEEILKQDKNFFDGMYYFYEVDFAE